VMFALAETTSAIQTPLGYAKAISAWFDPRRGLALGVAMAGVGLGGLVVLQLAARPDVRLRTGRPVSQYAGSEDCIGSAGAEPPA
jgi:hypothetical protein